ncbi:MULTISPECIES: GntR family transcriptional regulator [unclassified Rathayibacter]|uniref:GntR family transcriptional regulator n=1 Tax=unclassified Rathayibacter TaxID=2609250 RepID=UPI000F4CBD9E|nr:MULTISPECIES: GntR family transcriptional regulator [unclassified Rathayibacter]MCJ1703667.1 GntR family transcriptional regulator [Rathayibacter sp. VKM Ac-2926]ROP57834.1 DNA-binding transcriptional regulator YhcF (GntR family) [Rathayibacter sp. PhB186]ROS56219.1 DNA-binding transcriptional regulator YhcF (GntR family) [Rathayibacter sp. PhB185]TCL78333.1 DNA-binding transcriptional regulator YhcF (GntR family) [Rathayibacter sp. PhB192]TCM23936.1 DNA-binding transcriptional regulator Yh
MTAAGLGLRLEPGPRAPFEQIREGITAQVAAGSLLVGTRLPAVRTLAEELGVAPGTVARAYKELEAAGIVETRGRAGTVVSGGVDSVEHELQLAAGAYAARARALGATPERALQVAAAALRGPD